jgi:hypothetical protein
MTVISTASAETEFLKIYLSQYGFIYHWISVCNLEEILLSMIQHWEAVAGNPVADPELTKLKELCKGKKLFRNQGPTPNSVGQFLADFDEPNIEARLLKMIQHWEAASGKTVTQRQMSKIEKKLSKKEAMLFKRLALDTFYYLGKTEKKVPRLSPKQAEMIHVFIVSFIQLLDKVSKYEETSEHVAQGNFDEIKQKIEKKLETMVDIQKTSKKILHKYYSSMIKKRKESYIVSLMMKTTAESFYKIFRVNECAKCGYTFDP